MHTEQFQPLDFNEISIEAVKQNIDSFEAIMDKRRSVREFSDKDVPYEIIEKILKVANNAPSGANKQPWFFCAIKNTELKEKIKIAAEKEEYENYNGRLSEEWLDDLKKFGTDWQKPFITTAPWIIVIFKKSYDIDANGQKSKNYYVSESVGIAAGFLIAAIHMAGLVTLTHTPSPMNFLHNILQRPENEKPYLLLPIGFPADDAMVPVLDKKRLDESLGVY